MTISRRQFVSTIIALPAICKAENLMKIRPLTTNDGTYLDVPWVSHYPATIFPVPPASQYSWNKVDKIYELMFSNERNQLTCSKGQMLENIEIRYRAIQIN